MFKDHEQPELHAAKAAASAVEDQADPLAIYLAKLILSIPDERKPVFSMDYVAQSLREGRSERLLFRHEYLEFQDITHVAYTQEAIVLLPGLCPCDCHHGHLIMHDTPCCSPIEPFTYQRQEETK